MIKYLNTQVTGAEVPDYTTLCINITNCPCFCKGCHSSYLSKDIGEELNEESIVELIEKNYGTEGLDCVSIMGGDIDPKRVEELLLYVKHKYHGQIKTSWYSGRDELPKGINLKAFDFIKIGRYIEELGGLDSRKTNQRMYQYSEFSDEETIGKGWIDITYKFQRL